MSLVDDLLDCPYNLAHRIRPGAMPMHLYKCRRNHPKTKLATCPFNTIHHVPGPELNLHVSECPDRAAFELYKYCITDGSRQSHTITSQEPELIYNNEPPRSLTPESGFGDEEASKRSVGRSLQDDDECWDDSAVPAYNPHAYCKSANVIRKATHMKKSQKREFYQAERERLHSWRNGSTSSDSDDEVQKQMKATTRAEADEWWDNEIVPANNRRTKVETKPVEKAKRSDQQRKNEMDNMNVSFAQKLKMNQLSK